MFNDFYNKFKRFLLNIALFSKLLDEVNGKRLAFRTVQENEERQQKLIKSWKHKKVKLYSEFCFEKYKTSDKLFILGSGSSINEISETQWEIIKSNDSFGFNHWYFNEHIPTYYMVEIPRGEFGKIVMKNLEIASAKYMNIPKFIKPHSISERPDINDYPSGFLNNTYYGSPLHVQHNTISGYKILLRSLQKYDYNVKRETFDKAVWTRASLMLVLNFAIQAGYKEVILCGIDLNNTDYFYNSEKYQKSIFEKLPTYQIGKIHKTLDPKYHPLTIDHLVYAYRDEVFEKHEIGLHVLNKSSALYPSISLYKDKTREC